MTYQPQQPYQSQQPQPPVPYSPGSAYAPQQYQQVVVTSSPTAGVATASLVFGIIGALGGFCFFGIPCILAVILGHLGLAATKDGSRGGRGQAVAGLILGYLFVAPAVTFVVMGGITAAIGTIDPSATPTP